jgi:hypothetical protein
MPHRYAQKLEGEEKINIKTMNQHQAHPLEHPAAKRVLMKRQAPADTR